MAAVATTATDLWAAGEDGLWRFDGARWTSVHGKLGYGARLASDGRRVWAAGHDASDGSTAVAAWDGAGVSTHRLPGVPTALHAASGHAWVATMGSVKDGLHARVHHWDGTRWAALDVGAPMYVHDLWASGPDDLWAVGTVYPAAWTAHVGVIAHWDGARWARREAKDFVFSSVWGSAPGDVWVSGDTEFCQKCPPVLPDPVLLRWDGARLAKAASVELEEIAGRSAGDVWAIATRARPASPERTALLYRFDGARWSAAAALDAPFRPFGLHPAADGSLWGTDGGRILRRAPGR